MMMSRAQQMWCILVHKYITMNNVLYDYQFCFRKRHSTALALIEVVDNIYHNLDEGDRCCGAYLDLQKTFDTVDNELLQSKLYNYGIRGIVRKWFRSYLTNRQQLKFYLCCRRQILQSKYNLWCSTVLKVALQSCQGPPPSYIYI